jgi:hypothetical protein
MADELLKCADFAPHVGTDFVIASDDLPALAMTRTSAEPLQPTKGGNDLRPPFMLLFRLKSLSVIEQRLFELRHPAMGDLAIFLVPSAQDAESVEYCATFN